LVGYDGFKHRKGTKIHVVVDGYSMPIGIVVGPGNGYGSKGLITLIEGLEEKPREVYADSAYDTENIRRYLGSVGVEANIPVNPRNCRKPIPHNVEIIRSREALRMDKEPQADNHKV